MLILRLVLGDKERDLPLSCVRGSLVFSRLSRHSRSLDENRGSRKWSIDEIASENDPGTPNDALRLYVRKVETVHARAPAGARQMQASFIGNYSNQNMYGMGPASRHKTCTRTTREHAVVEMHLRIFTCQPCSASSRASRGPRTSRRRWSRKSIGCTSCAGGASAGRACR